jgi:hypothetical protein
MRFSKAFGSFAAQRNAVKEEGRKEEKGSPTRTEIVCWLMGQIH